MGLPLKIVKTAGVLLACGVWLQTAAAQTTPRRVVVEDVTPVKQIKHVSAANTHSGFEVPRYVSLKYNKVNGRQGPSLNHPVLWQYRRKGLPLIVVAEMDIWRKVRDMKGDESWVRTQALSGERFVITQNEINLYRKPSDDERIIAVSEAGALLSLGECVDANWCEVKSSGGHKGWAERRKLWGAAPF